MKLRWLDLLRSAAIFGMIVYHAAYDLQFFYSVQTIDVTTGGWKLFQIGVASLFLVVVGISAGFWTQTDGIVKGWRRGWLILSAATLVSLVTAIIDDRTWVRFGILHLIALSAFLLPFLRRINLFFIVTLAVAIVLLTPFGLMPVFPSVDYTPPIPWLGPVLLGFAAGIPLSERTPSERRGREGPLLECLSWPGRHSLAIYLLHQPVIIAALWLFRL